VIPSTGGTASRVTSHIHGGTSPCWSPDGTQIGFRSYRTGYSDIYTIPLAGGPATQLIDDEWVDGGPQWSPDGTKIAFMANRAGNLGIWVIDVPYASVPDAWGATWGRIKAEFLEKESD
jgi:TolB protein